MLSSTPDMTSTLPPVLVGPLLRRLEPARLVMWLVGTRALALTLRIDGVGDLALDASRCTVVPVGQRAFVHLIDVTLDAPLPQDVAIDYDLLVDGAPIAEWAPHLLYDGAQCPNFIDRKSVV